MKQYNNDRMCVRLLYIIVMTCTILPAFSFQIHQRIPAVVPMNQFSALHVKKRRRRKTTDADADSDLPDFDMDDPDVKSSSSSSAAAAKERTVSNNAVKVTETGVITEAMLGSSGTPTRSVRELLSDRSLEKTFVFDDKEDDGLDLPDLTRAESSQQPLGKKKARQAARIAAAEARKGDESDFDIDEFVKKIPFITNDDGKVTPIKILEAGAWLGIFLLVGWEFYINSPFFDRAAPITPVIY